MKPMCTWHTCQKPPEKGSYLCARHAAIERRTGREVMKRVTPGILETRTRIRAKLSERRQEQLTRDYTRPSKRSGPNNAD